MKKYKSCLFIILLLMIIPISFANDNTTVVNNENSLYFDSSTAADGDGSQIHPYKYLSDDKIVDNSTLYFADGEYSFSQSKSVKNLTIIGDSSNKTIIHGFGNTLSSDGNLSIFSLTLNNFTIINNNNLTLSKVIMMNTKTSSLNGAVTINSNDSFTQIYNSTFKNNYAVSGGAIHINAYKAVLIINQTNFINNTAYKDGGAIAIKHEAKVNLENTLFENNVARLNGGAIYTENSELSIKSSNFTQSKASFGGAMYDLNSTTFMLKVISDNNEAKYSGGAIYKKYGSSTISSSVFKSNRAVKGTSIFGENLLSFVVKHSIFTLNEANRVVYTNLIDKESFVNHIYLTNDENWLADSNFKNTKSILKRCSVKNLIFSTFISQNGLISQMKEYITKEISYFTNFIPPDILEFIESAFQIIKKENLNSMKYSDTAGLELKINPPGIAFNFLGNNISLILPATRNGEVMGLKINNDEIAIDRDSNCYNILINANNYLQINTTPEIHFPVNFDINRTDEGIVIDIGLFKVSNIGVNSDNGSISFKLNDVGKLTVDNSVLSFEYKNTTFSFNNPINYLK